MNGRPTVVVVRDAIQWDDALRAAPRADLLQSWQWGEFKRQTGSWAPLRLLALRDGVPCAGVQVLSREVAGARFLYAPRGPWWTDADGVAALVRWLRHHGWRTPMLRCDPPVMDAAALVKCGFRLAPRQVQPRATIVVDLTPSDEQMLANFDGQVRYNARLAERKGVDIVEGGVERIEEFWQLLTATAERKQFIERPLAYYRMLMELYGADARVLLARYQDATVAGAVIATYGRTAYYLYGASGGDRSVKPAELLQYRAMLWAKRHGATTYDMWGIPAHPGPSNPLYGVFRFKSGFGGSMVTYPGALDLALWPAPSRLPGALEALALKSRSLLRGQGFALHDHLA
ncbi:MAG TPA: peptidoglycan bridge formation glycyltransferase FemA/FemB family protein [Ktedonobacterales bacterium]|nr:peptidoglycan bridge formation glycyltransferase FemA/FemB family protein [Ktedonobacterales bacterium]